MSLTAFKRKSVIQYGSKRSGKPPGGIWLPRGPFGTNLLSFEEATKNYNNSGFSINGGHRNIGYVGKDSKFSKNGTPFRGTQPCGTGGLLGQYAQPLPTFNISNTQTLGDQYMYIKPSVLSTKGMLKTRFKWITSGQYPNYWVQPNYTGNQVDSSSQGMYIHKKTTSNMTYLDVNNTPTYVANIKTGGATLCYTSTARFNSYDDMANKGLYTKRLYQPITSGEQTLYIQRPCANPTGAQKPFPYAVQTGTGIMPSGTSITNVGNSCGTSSDIALSPPDWYTQTSSNNSINPNNATKVNCK